MKRTPTVGFRRPNKVKTLISIYSEGTKAIVAQTFGIRPAAGSGPLLTLLSPQSNPVCNCYQYGCFSLYPISISVFTPAQSNCTKEENKSEFDSIELKIAGVKAHLDTVCEDMF